MGSDLKKKLFIEILRVGKKELGAAAEEKIDKSTRTVGLNADTGVAGLWAGPAPRTLAQQSGNGRAAAS